MSRNLKPPTYCLHKSSGQAVVRIGGRDRYLGRHGTPESIEAYERVLAEWRAGLGIAPKTATAPAELTISQVIRQYADFADGHYTRDGQPTKELDGIKAALRPGVSCTGGMLARDFGPRSLKAVQQHLVSAGLCRGVVNARVNRIKRFVKWAVSEELVPASLYGIEGTRVLQGLLSLTKKHPCEALEKACEIALAHGCWRLRAVRQLLGR